MPKQNQYSTDMIPDGEIMLVTGTVDFSIITRRLEGEELVEDNKRKEANGMIREEKPHTRMNITNANVTYQNPAQPSIGELYIAERFFESKKNPQKGKCYEGKSKSSNLPVVYTRNAQNPDALDEIIPEGELAAGLKVTLIMRCFGAKKPGMHNGIALEGVICEEPPKYYNSGVNAATVSALADRGLKVNPASAEAIEAHKAKLAAETPVAAVAPVAQSASASASASASYGAPASYEANYAAPQAQPPAYAAQPAQSAQPAYAANYASASASAPIQPPAYGYPATPKSDVVAPAYPAEPGTAVYPPPSVTETPAGGVNI